MVDLSTSDSSCFHILHSRITLASFPGSCVWPAQEPGNEARITWDKFRFSVTPPSYQTLFIQDLVASLTLLAQLLRVMTSGCDSSTANRSQPEPHGCSSHSGVNFIVEEEGWQLSLHGSRKTLDSYPAAKYHNRSISGWVQAK